MLKLVFHNSYNWFLFLALQRPYLIFFNWKEYIVSLRWLFKIMEVILTQYVVYFSYRKVCIVEGLIIINVYIAHYLNRIIKNTVNIKSKAR